MGITRSAVGDENDSGASLVEIMVAMLILAILAVAFLPILIQGLKVSAVNATRATAVQLAHDQVELLRSQGTDCSVVEGLDSATAPVVAVQDSRGVSLAVTRHVAPCPTTASAYPTTIKVSITVAREDTHAILSTAETLVFVSVQ